MVRAMFGQKVVNRKTTKEQTDMLGLEGNYRSVSINQ